MPKRDKYGFYPVEKYDEKGRMVFCGPFAVASATGADPNKVCRRINRHRGRKLNRHIIKTGVDDLRYFLSEAGISFHSEKLWFRSYNRTLKRWRELEQVRNATYIILVTGHWISLRNDWLQDTRNPKPVDISKHKMYYRKRVQAVIKIKER